MSLVCRPHFCSAYDLVQDLDCLEQSKGFWWILLQLSAHYRFSRRQFLAASCFTHVLLGGLIWFSLYVDLAALPTAAFVMGALLFLVGIYFQLVCTVRRLHDLNICGWPALLTLVPLANLLLIGSLLLKAGTAGFNDFGHAPKW